jgi:hypothetical protein
VERQDPELRADERPERDRHEPGAVRERGQRPAIEEVEVARQVVAAPVAAAEEPCVERVEVRGLDEDVATGTEGARDAAEDRDRVRDARSAGS